VEKEKREAQVEETIAPRFYLRSVEGNPLKKQNVRDKQR
jgi:hypothetical protein